MSMNEIQIRWMIRKDMPQALAIENAAFSFPWTEDDFIRALRRRNCIGGTGSVFQPARLEPFR